MGKKYLLIIGLVATGILIISQSLCFSARKPTNMITGVNYPPSMERIEVSFTCEEPCWLGCTIWLQLDRWEKVVDLPPAQVLGTQTVTIGTLEYARNMKKFAVALWKEKYKSGQGPDPSNAAGKKNGFYMYGLLDRMTIEKGSDGRWRLVR